MEERKRMSTEKKILDTEKKSGKILENSVVISITGKSKTNVQKKKIYQELGTEKKNASKDNFRKKKERKLQSFDKKKELVHLYFCHY